MVIGPEVPHDRRMLPAGVHDRQRGDHARGEAVARANDVDRALDAHRRDVEGLNLRRDNQHALAPERDDDRARPGLLQQLLAGLAGLLDRGPAETDDPRGATGLVRVGLDGAVAEAPRDDAETGSSWSETMTASEMLATCPDALLRRLGKRLPAVMSRRFSS